MFPRYNGDPRRDFLSPLSCTMAAPQRVNLVGPFPLFAVVRPTLLRMLGWTALIIDGQQPMAVVDAGKTHGGHLFHAVHTRAAAESLQAALRQADRYLPCSAGLRLLTTQFWRDTCVAGSDYRSLVFPLYQHRRPITFGSWSAALERKRRKRFHLPRLEDDRAGELQ